MNIEDAWLFIRYEYRECMIMNIKDAWLFHKYMNIKLHAHFINIEFHDWFMRYECWTWLMSVGLHDYLVIIWFYKIRFYFIRICIRGLGIMFAYTLLFLSLLECYQYHESKFCEMI